MKIKKKVRYILLAILSIILIMIVVAMFNPLRRSREKIREQILESIPVGTSMEEAIKIIDEHPKWELRFENKKDGYVLRDGTPSSPAFAGDTIGKQYIEFHMGGYRNIIAVDVLVYLGFDEDGKLINAHVDKEYDGV